MAVANHAGASGNGESETDDTSSLGASIGWQLSMAGRLIRGEAETALAAFGLRNRHFGVLLILAAIGPAPQGEVAQRGFMDKSTMVAVVDHLEQLGFVERRRNPANRRSHELILTDDGSAALAQAKRTVAEIEERFLAPLSGPERERLGVALKRLLAAHGLA